MTILISNDIRDKLHKIQYESVVKGKKKSFGKIIEELVACRDVSGEEKKNG